MLKHVKEKSPIERVKEIAFEVSCHNCQMKYIGERKRSMKRRMTVHRYAVKKMDVQNGVAVHVQRCQHSSSGSLPEFVQQGKTTETERPLKPFRFRKTVAYTYPQFGNHS